MAREAFAGLIGLTLAACHAGDTPRLTVPAPDDEHHAAARVDSAARKHMPSHDGLGGAAEAPEYLLRAPEPDIRLAGPPTPEPAREPGKGWGWLGRSVQRKVPIYNGTRGVRFEIGGLRLGSVVRLQPYKTRHNCRGGWFRVEPRGYACLTEGLRVSREEVPPAGSKLTPPDPNAELPFRYVHVTDRSEWLYGELPDKDQIEAVEAGDDETIEELSARSLDGAYFLAVEDDPKAHPKGWLQTLHGNYVDAEDTRDIQPSKLQGSLLSEDEMPLPVAFVVKPDAEVLEPTRGEHLEPVGLAERYARTPIDPASVDSSHVRVLGEDLMLDRDHVRVATRRAPPEDLEEGERWLHVDLDDQVLVAYEGSEPKFATLIASGLAPRETPTGAYRVRYKYRTTTMRGEDETGPFEVQEVPWTMFYYKSYAIHGAYWHDAFGAPRSHGCTNLAPLDARWVFQFTSPDLPPGWEHAADSGTRVVFTRDEDGA